MFDPLNNESAIAATRCDSNEIYLQLKPGQSLVLKSNTRENMQGEQWRYFQVSEKEAEEIQGTWNIEFVSGGPELPTSFETNEYGSWTELSTDETAKHFAGTARYTLTFEKPSITADEWLLDLRDLRESARVTLNGTQVGTVWSLPFQIKVGDYLQPGKNTLELEITNTAANRIRDMDQRGVDWKIMHEINFVNINYKPFDASNWAIEPAGLLTAIQLIPVNSIDPN